MATDFYSATCPGCGAPVTGTLDSEPDVPLYGCGSWGRGTRCLELRTGKRPSEIPNVVPLDLDDEILFQVLNVLLTGAEIRRAAGR